MYSVIPRNTNVWNQVSKMEERADVHPYGVLPSGNRWLEEDATLLNKRSTSFGKWSKLNDTLILELLSMFSGPELAHLSSISHLFYVYIHHEYLWRELVLDRWKGDFFYLKNWCALALVLRLPAMYSNPCHIFNDAGDQPTFTVILIAQLRLKLWH